MLRDGIRCVGGVANAGPPVELEDEYQTTAVAYYAETEGISRQDARNIISDQEVILSVANELGFEFDEDESVYFEPHGRTQTAVVHSSDEEHISAFAVLPISVNTKMRIEDVDIESRIPLEVSDETVAEVKESIPGVQGVYVRESDGALMVDAVPTTDGARASRDPGVLKVRGYSTTIVSYGDEAADSLPIRGGAAMSKCTAGLPAKYGSYKGFISAAHCDDVTRLFGSTKNSGVSTRATMRKQIHNANADIAFYSVSSSNTLTRTRYASSATSPVRVGAPASVGPGTVVCHRGMTTGYQCGRVTSIAYKPTYSGACPGGTCNSVFVRVSAKQEGGDSGGPWAAGSRPIGIHKGGSSTFSIYSKLHRVPSGVQILS